MPHVIVKLWPGKSEAQKRNLADRITRDVMDIFQSKKSRRRNGPSGFTDPSWPIRTNSTKNRDTECEESRNGSP
jgi:hypothetical protein